jgi:hypothetical protein
LQPALQKLLLNVIRGKAKRFAVCAGGFTEALHSSENVGASRVKQVVVVEFARRAKSFDALESFLQAGAHGNRNGVIKRDYGSIVECQQAFVELRNLRPIRTFRSGGFDVEGSYGGLQLIGPDRCPS